MLLSREQAPPDSAVRHSDVRLAVEVAADLCHERARPVSTDDTRGAVADVASWVRGVCHLRGLDDLGNGDAAVPPASAGVLAHHVTVLVVFVRFLLHPLV